MKLHGRFEDTINLEELPKMENDSDDVYHLGVALEPVDSHQVIDPQQGQGWVEVVCPLTKRRYLHIVKCPNKFAITCRGCGETI